MGYTSGLFTTLARRVFRILFALFLLIPLLEIYLLIKVGGIIGAWPTVFLVVFTAVLGAFLLRVQGLMTLNKVQVALARGEAETEARPEEGSPKRLGCPRCGESYLELLTVGTWDQ